MNTKIQIKSVLGNILYEYESDDNSLKKTVEEAVKQNKDLSRADLSNANLFDANLVGARLYDADLSGANLRWAHLFGADLYKADLSEANLEKVNLSGANLYYANLSKAHLSYANLYGATLFHANLSGADLIGTNLRWADLYKADLIGTNLRGADLSHANLRETNLSGAETIPFIPLYLSEGEFIAYKKIKDVIVKLKILEDSKRSRATGDKCRCDKALVLELQDMEGKKLEVTEIVNDIYATCTYKVGEIVEADKWDDNRFNECSHGIHFFLDRQSAVDY